MIAPDKEPKIPLYSWGGQIDFKPELAAPKIEQTEPANDSSDWLSKIQAFVQPIHIELGLLLLLLSSAWLALRGRLKL